MRVRRVSQYSYMLLQLFDLRLEYGNFALLGFCLLNNSFQIFINHFILISLRLNIILELLIVFPSLNMEVVLDHLSLLYQNIHHDVYLFPNVVSFLFEKLKEVVPCHQLVLQGLDLFIH